jgi:hypothetical protein
MQEYQIFIGVLNVTMLSLRWIGNLLNLLNLILQYIMHERLSLQRFYLLLCNGM